MNNLKALRETRGMKQSDFAETLDMKPSTYAGYENGSRDPSTDIWISVSERYRVSIDYLMGQTDNPHGTKFAGKSKIEERYSALDNHGKKLIDTILDLELERAGTIIQMPETPIIDLGTIRKYLSRPAAGVNGLVEGEDYEDIPRTPDMPKNADFCLVVSGDSMEPYIHDGETVYITESDPLHDMDVGVFSVDGATYVKQYAPSYDGSLYLLSANPERESANITISKNSNQNVQYFGKVILKKKLPPPHYK